MIAPESFDVVMKRFGDRRFKATWVKALSQFEAQLTHDGLLDAYILIYTFNFTPDQEYYEYRHNIFDAFLAYPDALDVIKLAFEQLFTLFPLEEQREFDGFFRLVSERGIDPRAIRESVESNRRLRSAVAA